MTDETGNSKLEIRNSKIETGSARWLSRSNRQSTIDQSSIAEESQSAIVNRQSSITLPLLLEVGCEEIPARFLRDAEKGLGERVQAALRQARLVAR